MEIRRQVLAVSLLVCFLGMDSSVKRAGGADGVRERTGSPTLAVNTLDTSSTITKSTSRFEPAWMEDYSDAVGQAMTDQKLLFICFDRPDSQSQRDRVTEAANESMMVASSLEEYVLLATSVETEIKEDGENRPLLDFPAFAEMRGRPGLAMVDYRDSSSPEYGHVVTVYPVNQSRQVSAETMDSIVQLPPGSLTQRSLVLAVMLHREQPQSVNADWHPTLASEVESHSLHQARIANQGHHNWGTRFQRINARLGNGMLAQEVCAESWPGQPLMDAAEECVNSWRHSSGHWRAVSGRQRLFAFDMKRGTNGTWYATGIFAR